MYDKDIKEHDPNVASSTRNSHSSTLKQQIQSIYRANDKLPKMIEGDDIVQQKIEGTYVNLMLIKREKETNKNQPKQEGQDQSKRNDYEDIVASKEEIELEKIFEIKQDKATIKPKGKILIYGRAGVGKTTLCTYIAYKWGKQELWDNRFDYVFVLPLRKLTLGYLKEASYGKRLTTIPLECFIHSCITEKGVEETNVDDIKSVLQKDKTHLILDGYDEIANEDTENNLFIRKILNQAILYN